VNRVKVKPMIPGTEQQTVKSFLAATTFAVFVPLLSAYSNTSSLSEMPIPPSRLTPNQK